MNRIKKLRLENELTLKQLSSEIKKKYNLNISDGQLSNYENGKRQPRDPEVWSKLAEFFNVTLAYLMGYDVSDTAQYGFRGILDTEETSFEAYRDTKEYKKVFSICKDRQIIYLLKNHSFLSDKTIEEISQALVTSDMKTFWETFIKADDAARERILSKQNDLLTISLKDQVSLIQKYRNNLAHGIDPSSTDKK